MDARFEQCDLNRERMPFEDASVDIASSQFALQYVFRDEQCVRHYFSEVRRILKPGGIFLAVLPDGNRIARTLASTPGSTSTSFGHFKLGKFRDTERALATNDPPVGIAYTFCLQSESCAEYVVSPSYLEKLAGDYGLAPAFDDCGFFVPGDRFLSNITEDSMHGVRLILKKSQVTQIDWESLSLFTVFMALVDSSKERSSRNGEVT